MGITTRYQGTSVFDKLQVHKGKFYIEGYAMPLQWSVLAEHDMGADTAIDTKAYTATIACKLVAAWVTVTEVMTGNAATEIMGIYHAASGSGVTLTDTDYTMTKAETVFSNVKNATTMLVGYANTHNLAIGDSVYLYTAAGVAGDRTAGKVIVNLLFEAV